MKLLVLVLCCGLLATVQAVNEDDARLFARRSTKTWYQLTTTTTVVPLTCALFTSTNPCRRRRLRRFSAVKPLGKSLDGSAELTGTLSEGKSMGELEEGGDRSGRGLAITFITTTTSTYTVTSQSINSSTTFSLSFYCSAANAVIPPACG